MKNMSLTIIEKSRQELLESLKKESVFARSAAELKAEYLSLTIADVNDKEGALKVATARKHMVKIRTTLDKFRKSVTKPLTDAKKEVDKTAADMQAEFDVIEKHLQDEEGKIQRELDLIETKRKNAIHERHNVLNRAGMFLNEDVFVCVHLNEALEDLSVPLHFIGSTTVNYNTVWDDEKFKEFAAKAEARSVRLKEIFDQQSKKIEELNNKLNEQQQVKPEQKFDITKQDEQIEKIGTTLPEQWFIDRVGEMVMANSSSYNGRGQIIFCSHRPMKIEDEKHATYLCNTSQKYFNFRFSEYDRLTKQDEVPEAFMKKSSPLTTKEAFPMVDPNRKFINNVSIVDYCEMLGFVKGMPDGTRMYYLDGNWITKTNNNEKLLMTKMEIAKLSDIPESGEVEHLLLAAVYKIAEITKCTADEALQLIINYRQLIF